MSVIAAALKHMLAAGMDSVAIVEAVAAMEAELAASAVVDRAPKPGALRMRRLRERHKASQSVTCDAEVTEVTVGDGELPLSPPSPKDPQTPKEPQPPHTPTGEDAHVREGPDPIRSCFTAWNAMAEFHGLPIAEKLTDKRRTHLRARVDDYTEAVVLDAIAAVPSKPWLMGVNDRRWKADIDWLLRPDSITRLREGKYDHGQPARPANDGGLCASPAEAMSAARRSLGIDR